MANITMYSTHCPKCAQLEKKLNQMGIKYSICTDVNVMKDLGMKSAPFLQVDDKLMNFAEAWKWTSNQEVK